MWVTKLLISPVKIRNFCPKKSKFGPKMAFLFFLGQALPAHLVGGCGARAVSRKTPIYFMLNKNNSQLSYQYDKMDHYHWRCSLHVRFVLFQGSSSDFNMIIENLLYQIK